MNREAPTTARSAGPPLGYALMVAKLFVCNQSLEVRQTFLSVSFFDLCFFATPLVTPQGRNACLTHVGAYHYAAPRCLRLNF
jgi:hypothetical protein